MDGPELLPEIPRWIQNLLAITVTPSLMGLSFWFIKDYLKKNKDGLASIEKQMASFVETVTKKVDDQYKENKELSKSTNEKLHTMGMDLVSIKRAINEEILGMKERILELSKNPAVTSNEKLERFINAYKENTGKIVAFMEEAKHNFGKIIDLDGVSKRHEELLKKMLTIAQANHDQYTQIKNVLDVIAKKRGP